MFGAEGKGLRPLVRRTCDDAVSIPLAGSVESLNVSVAAALLLYEARRQRWLSRRSTSSTATTSCTRGRSTTRASSSTGSRASSPSRARAEWSSSTASARSATHGPLEVRYAQHADALLERLAAENRGKETVCLVSSDAAIRGTSGQEVQKRSSKTFLGDLDEPTHGETSRYRVGDRVDEETRKRLEELRRGKGSG